MELAAASFSRAKVPLTMVSKATVSPLPARMVILATVWPKLRRIKEVESKPKDEGCLGLRNIPWNMAVMSAKYGKAGLCCAFRSVSAPFASGVRRRAEQLAIRV